jgi:hypothetical protein
MNYVKLSEVQRFKAYENNKVLYAAINEIIERIDPLQLAHIGNEYDIEVKEIIGNLEKCNTPEDVRKLVYEVFTYWFNSDCVEHFVYNTYFDKEIFELKYLLE